MKQNLEARRDDSVSRGRTRFVAVVVGACVLLGACSEPVDEPPQAQMSESLALQSLTTMSAIAAQRTPEAMERLCDLSLHGCEGISGAVVAYPESAPDGNHPPEIICSRAVDDRHWMLVVQGDDGYGRPYVSQVVLALDEDGSPVPHREPAFWLGVAYAGTKVTGSTSWSTAYHPQEGVTAEAHTNKQLERARRACDT